MRWLRLLYLQRQKKYLVKNKDLRTAQNLVGQEAPGSAGAAFDNSIAYVDPERRTSPYEAYVRDV